MDVHYFHLSDFDSGREIHFLAVGYKNEPAVIYRHDDYVFQPFQYFPDRRNIKWLPYQVGSTLFFFFFLLLYGME